MVSEHNVGLIVQARMGSTRLPGKVMLPIGNISLIEMLLRRVSQSQLVDKIVLATSCAEEDNVLVDLVQRLGFDVFRGHPKDVQSRYIGAAQEYGFDVIVRITGDCPLIDPGLIDECIELFFKSEADYCSNIDPPCYPDGLDVEVFSRLSLEHSAPFSTSYAKEHVTANLRSDLGVTRLSLLTNYDGSQHRWTIDEPDDYRFLLELYKALGQNLLSMDWRAIAAFLDDNLNLSLINSMHRRNEGGGVSSGQKLWKRAKRVIAGGNMLLSKRPEMFLPDKWPSYFSRAKGYNVWDLDDIKYVDMATMSVGTNSLGYGHEEVDAAVLKVISLGNMSTLNCREEVELAERLIELHPWSDKVRFARTGGEANAIAVRIARACSGRDGVAICGYHGWHDWYLASNLNGRDNLAEHLLTGLNTSGVPSNLEGTIFPFHYNDLGALRTLMATENIGVIKMEVQRNVEPAPGFLEGVRQVADENNAVLIFDECTTGFRSTFGGLHLKYNVNPDMAIFGKALGNGYAITAVVGVEQVMDFAQETFMSSTFWTERIGSAAAIATLNVMEREKSWDIISNQGDYLRKKICGISERLNVQIEQTGLSSLNNLSFQLEAATNLEAKTFVTQEMLKKGYLFANSTYMSMAHTDEIINLFADDLESVLARFKEALYAGNSTSELLVGGVCHSGFKRLN